MSRTVFEGSGRMVKSVPGAELMKDMFKLSAKNVGRHLAFNDTLPADIVRGNKDSELVYRSRSFADAVVSLCTFGKKKIISPEERTRKLLEASFNQFDASRSGYLSRADTRLLLLVLEVPLPMDRLDEAVQNIDSHETNMITISMFCKWWHSQEPEVSRAAMIGLDLDPTPTIPKVRKVRPQPEKSPRRASSPRVKSPKKMKGKQKDPSGETAKGKKKGNKTGKTKRGKKGDSMSGSDESSVVSPFYILALAYKMAELDAPPSENFLKKIVVGDGASMEGIKALLNNAEKARLRKAMQEGNTTKAAFFSNLEHAHRWTEMTGQRFHDSILQKIMANDDYHPFLEWLVARASNEGVDTVGKLGSALQGVCTEGEWLEFLFTFRKVMPENQYEEVCAKYNLTSSGLLPTPGGSESPQ